MRLTIYSLQKAEAGRRKGLEDEVREKMGLITRLRGEREEMQYHLDQKKAALPASKVSNIILAQDDITSVFPGGQ